MDYTENYSLRAPQRGENVYVADINYNSEKIDDLLYKNRRISTGAEWDENTQYHTGDLVVYNHVLYRALADTTGAWDSTKWTATNLSAEVLEAKASGGTEVEANPTGTATGNLTKVGIDGTVYAIPTGTEVEANPTASATDTLEKVGIGGTVYEIEGGGGSADVTKTASGNPITFSDGADAPMVECKASISAKQDLHGYSKPWVGGSGKNKLPNEIESDSASGVTWVVNEDGSITFNGTATAEIYNKLYFSKDLQLSATSYVFSGGGTIQFQIANKAENRAYVNLIGGGLFTVQSSWAGDMIARFIIPNGATLNNVTLYPMIRLSTVTDSTFEPYSNICPIEGYDEVEVGVAGKNLVIDSVVNSTVDRYGTVLYVKAGLKPSTRYTISFKGTQGNQLYLNENVFEYKYFVVNSGVTSVTVKTLNSININSITQGYNGRWIFIKNNIAQSSPSVFDELQLELGSTATTYEPYNPNSKTYTVSLGSTRYGGELDVVRGVLQATWGYIASYAGETLPGRWLSDRDEYVSGNTPTTGAEVAYELATPTEITLTAEQIRSLSGSNTLTTDADTMEVEYITEDYQAIVDLIEDGGGSSTLAELSDVDLATPADGQLLVYDGTSWVNGNIAGANVQPLIYSTEEREVGVWTDGKPLYQKTVTFGSVSGSSASLSLGIANVDYINYISEGSSINGALPLPYVHSQQSQDIGGFFSVSAQDTTFEIRIGSASVGNVNSVTLTVQYTKTTDTAGSGTWTPSGIPAVHYSTEEQAVGTDTTGETIYEITYVGGMTIPKGSWGSTGIEVTGRVISVDGIITRDGEPIPFGFWTSSIVSIWLLRDSDIKVQMSSYQTTETYLLQRMTVRYTKATATRSLNASVTALKADVSDEKAELEDLSTDTETSLTKANTEGEGTLSEMETITEGTEDED